MCQKVWFIEYPLKCISLYSSMTLPTKQEDYDGHTVIYYARKILFLCSQERMSL